MSRIRLGISFQRTFRKSIATMASRRPTVSPFTTAVVAAMRKMYPEKLADSSFDNTGLLLEAPHRPHLKNAVLVTVDLTKVVVDEAIAKKVSIIIAYHPIIFRPLKSFTLANTQQASLLRLAQEGISVYCPHTAVDAAPGGMNDWLADIICDLNHPTGLLFEPIASRSVITPVDNPPEGFEGAGYGRIIKYKKPTDLGTIVRRIMKGLRLEDGLSVAVPQWIPSGEKSKIMISSVGVCAGSGGSLLNGLDVDLLFTGELGHHETLAAVEQGKCVITVFHSKSERGYIVQMAIWLERAIAEELSGGTSYVAFDRQMIISESDRDPYSIISGEALVGENW